MITTRSWPLSLFQHHYRVGSLDISPEYQRRVVWNAKTQMLLVDSVARGLPIGAITLYVDIIKPGGGERYEVIDGKQRLTALFNFMDGKLIVRKTVTDDEEDQIGGDTDVAEAIYGRKYSDIDSSYRIRIDQYEVPVFLVSGSRSDAVAAFTRMNRNPYALKPQELRHALYRDAFFLEMAIDVTKSLSKTLCKENESWSWYVQSGLGTKDQADRMQDVQFVSELLALLLRGPQNRRDELDSIYDSHRDQKGAGAKRLRKAKQSLENICTQLWDLFGGKNLQAHNFPAGAENDYYALVGAIRERGLLTGVQMKKYGPSVSTTISEFRRQVAISIEKARGSDTKKARGSDTEEEESSRVHKDVAAYASTFLGGQQNNKTRRETRQAIWVNVLSDVVSAADAPKFTQMQRHLIWVRTSEKKCGRCGKEVKWEEYEAGHINPRALAGRSDLSNGQIEHATCNKKAGGAG